jgi:hypothetical protein
MIKKTAYFFALVICSSAATLIFVNAASSSDTLFTFFNLSSGKKTTISLPNQHINAPKIPESITFAGEKVPLDDIEVRERFDKELVIHANRHSSTIFLIKRANRFFPVIEKILEEQGVPNDFKYLCMAESALDNVVSPAGATGFWQFMKGTAPKYDLYISAEVDERYNLEKATEAACKYLKEAKETSGSWTTAAAGYNMGIAGINNQINKQTDSIYYNLFLNSETSRYLFNILAIKTIYENQHEYGYYLDKEDLYEPYDTKTVAIDSATNWVDFAKENGTNYKMVRKLNPWIREPKLTNKERRTYWVKIPD